ncbi:replication-relaxation family protein [Streptomyces laculatispora]|uniref:Replication-relaxation family protein n=1 Tax=Streptomyces laculatispora TaxID=887464 RepID=A0ABY9IEU8_9ACTN|nr:replication-relaxation family protein [Streptomyces laculatispora]WLQ45124.1 replication-relaxation family protein [Streptomyces laculatispora]
MAGKRKTNEAGSTNDLRADVLSVLGVLKVATADQIQRLASPHLSHRHTLKETPAKRKEARTASHRGAANDLRRHGLVVDGGRTRGNEEVRILTAAGLAAAGLDLDREPEEMGGMPKSAGRSGASHPMTVNETVIALIRPKPDLDLVAGEPAEAVAAAQAAVEAPDGIDTLTSYATEVALPVKGTWKNPAIGSARADVVVTAPEVGVPLLFIEADNCTEEAVLIAARFDKYLRFFRRQEKDTDGKEKPMWRTRWSAPLWEEYERVHPPVLLVFHQGGKRSVKNQMERVADLTRPHWQGRWHAEGGYHSYDGCIPIVATTLERLREHGPAGPAFWRYGRDRLEPLQDAIGNHRRDAYLARRRQAAREEERRREEERAAEREARRPTCADCGAKFTDDRWRAVGYTHRPESHTNLCEDCQSRAVAAEQQAKADERERQEQLRRQAEEAAAREAAEAEAKKNRGLFGRRR